MARQYTAHLSPRLIAVFSNEIIPNLVLDYRCCASKILMLLSSVFFCIIVLQEKECRYEQR